MRGCTNLGTADLSLTASRYTACDRLRGGIQRADARDAIPGPFRRFAALYADRADADAEYDVLLDPHSTDLVGSYDVSLMYKDAEARYM